MGPKKQRMLPRQLGEEKEQHDREQAAQNDEAIRTSIASSRASIPFNHLGNQTFQQNFQQMPDNAPDVTTTMQQPLGMTAPTGLDFEWGNFSNQGFVNQSSFGTTPTLNNDSPAGQHDQEQPMSPFTVGPQNGFPSSLEDMSQYGMHGLLYTTGLQNGHSSSMDSTPGGQYPMGTMSGGQQSNSSSMDSTFGGQYPMGTMSARQPPMSTLNPLGLETMTPGPQYGVDLSAGPRELWQRYSGYQDNPTMDNLDERIRQLQRPISEQTDPTIPLTATHDGNFRYSQDTTLQQHPTTTGFGQPGQTQNHSVSEDSSRHDSTSSADNVAITAPQSRPSQPAAIAPTAANLGPCSRQTQMPPRPKPGRKPLPQEDAQDRRRLQNRMAQRSFRDKRAQKVSDLTKDNAAIREQAEQVHRKLSNALEDQRRRATELALQNEKLKAELEAAKKRADDAERKLQMASHSNGVVRSLGFPHATLQNIGTGTSLPPMMANWNGPVGEHARASSGAVATPAVDNNNNNNNNTNWAEYETDMTATWSSRRTNNATQNNAVQNNAPQNNGTQNNDNDSQWLSNSMDVDGENDQCGFCTDEGNCACMQSQNAQAQTQPQPQTLPQPVIQPGGCEACIADPARAARCKAIADQGELSQRPTQTTSSNGQRTDSLAPIPGMVSCSTAVDRLGPNMPSIGDLFPGTFHVYPGTSGSSYDLAEQEVAQVLQSMRRNTASGADLQKQ